MGYRRSGIAPIVLGNVFHGNRSKKFPESTHRTSIKIKFHFSSSSLSSSIAPTKNAYLLPRMKCSKCSNLKLFFILLSGRFQLSPCFVCRPVSQQIEIPHSRQQARRQRLHVSRRDQPPAEPDNDAEPSVAHPVVLRAHRRGVRDLGSARSMAVIWACRCRSDSIRASSGWRASWRSPDTVAVAAVAIATMRRGRARSIADSFDIPFDSWRLSSQVIVAVCTWSHFCVRVSIIDYSFGFIDLFYGIYSTFFICIILSNKYRLFTIVDSLISVLGERLCVYAVCGWIRDLVCVCDCMRGFVTVCGWIGHCVCVRGLVIVCPKCDQSRVCIGTVTYCMSVCVVVHRIRWGLVIVCLKCDQLRVCIGTVTYCTGMCMRGLVTVCMIFLTNWREGCKCSL